MFKVNITHIKFLLIKKKEKQCLKNNLLFFIYVAPAIRRYGRNKVATFS